MDSNTLHKKYMNRCLELAHLGLGNTVPNPMVGSVIVHGDRIIGEGYHKKAGEPHAEVNAIASVADRELLPESTLYVNLEPCSHTGKTPPCADLVIRNRIPSVVIGTHDPNALVSGKGIYKLEQAGIKILNGICRNACIGLNRRFFTYHTLKRPYVILKWAQSADGFIDKFREETINARPAWISNEISKMLVHKWRSEEQAIMVGTQTALLDNPQLNVREWYGRSPLRIVIDRSLRLPQRLNLFDNQYKTLIINEIKEEVSGNCIFRKTAFDNDFLSSLMKILYEQGIQSLIAEGGKRLLESFIAADLWDEARIITGHQDFGSGIKAPVLSGQQKEEVYIDNDLLTLFYNKDRLDQFIT
jgi:diaminohydroxyphosphoribosylaminopyrimidine deaminase / 5-amino-6-(5-phosphoribosylamino)uracil reductase